MENSVITTDCGAVSNMVNANHYADNYSDAAAKAINAGTDLNTETIFSGQYMEAAIASGETNVSVVNEALRRSLLARFKAGLFDPLEGQVYTSLGLADIATDDHQSQNYDAALQSFVLLRNDNHTLPLKPNQKIAILGPKIFSQETLLEQYYGDQVCYGGGFSCIETISAALTKAAGGPSFATSFQAINVTSNDTSSFGVALEIAKLSDFIVLVLGLNREVEGETLDRSGTDLPGVQSEFALTLLALGKPTVLIFINGGMISFDAIAQTKTPVAIVEAFYPGFEGARALASALYGTSNRWGKLPVTIYSSSFQEKQNFFSFDMTAPPGRTYRYYQDAPLYTFGHGLSLTTFNYSCVQRFDSFEVRCEIDNTGSIDGDEVVLAFHRVSDGIRAKVSHPFPVRNLVNFERVHIPAQRTAVVQFHFSPLQFQSTTEDGGQHVYPGLHFIDIGTIPQFTAIWVL
jgi:hypothetical protein